MWSVGPTVCELRVETALPPLLVGRTLFGRRFRLHTVSKEVVIPGSAVSSPSLTAIWQLNEL